MHDSPYPPDTSATAARLVCHPTAAAAAAATPRPTDVQRPSATDSRSPCPAPSDGTTAFRCSCRRTAANTATGCAAASAATAETIERPMHG